MSYQTTDLFELYNGDLLIPDLVLDPVKSVIAKDGTTVIERRTQEFFIKNTSAISYNAKLVSQDNSIQILKQPGVIHPTQVQAFSIEFAPAEVKDLDGLLHFEIDPL